MGLSKHEHVDILLCLSWKVCSPLNKRQEADGRKWILWKITRHSCHNLNSCISIQTNLQNYFACRHFPSSQFNPISSICLCLYSRSEPLSITLIQKLQSELLYCQNQVVAHAIILTLDVMNNLTRYLINITACLAVVYDYHQIPMPLWVLEKGCSTSEFNMPSSCHVLQQFPSVNMSKAITIICVVRNECGVWESTKIDGVIRNRNEHVFHGE